MRYFDREEWPGFLAAIKANPADDLPRLVAADWLEENGEPERAWFVRVQCRVANGQQCRWSGPNVKACADANGRRHSYRVETWCDGCNQYRLDYGRLSALADSIYGKLLGPVALAGGTWTVERGFIPTVRAPLSALIGGVCPRCFGRGAVQIEPPYSARMTCDDCDGSGRTVGVLRELVRSEPVERVGVVGSTPWRNEDGSYSWWLMYEGTSEDPADVPEKVWSLLTKNGGRSNYPTESAARDALSAALLRWASQPACELR